MLSTILFYPIALSLVFLLLQTLAVGLFSKPRNIPGPFIARFTKLWYFWHVYRGHFERDNIELHRKYALKGQYLAPIVRIGPHLYSISTGDKTVYGIQSKMPKTSWYDGWKHPSPNRQTLFTERNIKSHGEFRRKFQAMYSLSSLVSYEMYVDECASIFQERLEETSRKGTAIDMAHWFQCYAFDVIGDITFGKRFGFLDAGQDVGGLMGALDASMPYSTLVGIFSWAHPYLYAISEKMPGSGAAGRTFLMKFCGQTIETRRAERKERGIDKTEEDDVEKAEEPEDGTPETFLDKLLNAERDQKRGIVPYHSFMMGMSNIIAGSDTTAVSLSSILYHLIRTPKAIQKLREEADTFTKEGKCDKDRVGFKTSQEMRYLQACIKEGLRLHSATGLPLWRKVPAGGAEICGEYFPAGAEVGVNTWVAHCDEDIWGKDARQFKPERWIEAEDEDDDKLKKMEASFMAVSADSRNGCWNETDFNNSLGWAREHASADIFPTLKLIPQIVRRFDFTLEQADKQLEARNYWFVKPVDFRVKVQLRREKT